MGSIVPPWSDFIVEFSAKFSCFKHILISPIVELFENYLPQTLILVSIFSSIVITSKPLSFYFSSRFQVYTSVDPDFS